MKKTIEELNRNFAKYRGLSIDHKKAIDSLATLEIENKASVIDELRKKQKLLKIRQWNLCMLLLRYRRFVLIITRMEHLHSEVVVMTAIIATKNAKFVDMK